MKNLTEDLIKSRDHEIKTYLSSMKAMYSNAIAQNGEIYDIASKNTDNFRNITADSILKDSRIIKILRYSIAPSISQMKFGQLFGLNSIGKFENNKLEQRSNSFRNLEKIALNIAIFLRDNIDPARYIWLDPMQTNDTPNLAYEYAKKWTCSIASDQNAQTKYRNWRKDQQEHAIASTLVSMGYVKSGYKGIVTKDTDIKIGEFTQELRVQGRTRQKADVIVRSKKNNKLVLIEAKAVGVELDSTKRIKECCDKANDWMSSKDLNNPEVVSVIAGFFNKTGISSLTASKIKVVWEHCLSELNNIL